MRRAWLQTQSNLERWSAYVLLSRNRTAELEPDVLVIAVNVNGVSRVDCKRNHSHSLWCGHAWD